MDDDAEPHRDALERLLTSPRAADPGSAGPVLDGCAWRRHHRSAAPLPVAAVCGAASAVRLRRRTRLPRWTARPSSVCLYAGTRSAPSGCRGGSSSSVTTTRNIRCGWAEWAKSAWYPRASLSTRWRSAGARPRGRSRFWNRLLGAHYVSSPWRTYWKDLYRIRNLVAMKVEHQGLSAAGLALVIAGYVAKTLLYETRPWRRIPWLIRFALKRLQRGFQRSVARRMGGSTRARAPDPPTSRSSCPRGWQALKRQRARERLQSRRPIRTQ